MKTYEITESKPISSWGYVGYSLLYSLPIIGIILLLINAFKASNVNVRNYARSFIIVFVIVLVFYLAIAVAFIVLLATTEWTPDMGGGEYEVFNRLLGMLGA